MKTLVTGTAGFIGNALAKKLLDRGDVQSTYADVSGLINNFDYKPDGIGEFVKWYREFYK